MRVLVINGPNLNMLGYREPDIYGRKTYDELCEYLKNVSRSLGIDVEIFQSNHEGAIIDRIQDAFFDLFDALIINAGAYTHYSYAIHDALAILKCKVIEVHLSDIDNRDEFRKFSVISDIADKRFYGKGFESYKEALEYVASND